MKEQPPLQHNGPTPTSASTPPGRRQSIIAPQQPGIIPMQLMRPPNLQTINHPQTSLQQTNINHTGLQPIQRQQPIAPGMQQMGPGMLHLQEPQQPPLHGRGLPYPASRQ